MWVLGRLSTHEKSCGREVPDKKLWARRREREDAKEKTEVRNKKTSSQRREVTELIVVVNPFGHRPESTKVVR